MKPLNMAFRTWYRMGIYRIKHQIFEVLNFRSCYSSFAGSNDAEKMSKSLNDSSLNFKYSTIEKATGAFDSSNKLGQGGFGTVYKVFVSILLYFYFFSK